MDSVVIILSVVIAILIVVVFWLYRKLYKQTMCPKPAQVESGSSNVNDAIEALGLDVSKLHGTVDDSQGLDPSLVELQSLMNVWKDGSKQISDSWLPTPSTQDPTAAAGTAATIHGLALAGVGVGTSAGAGAGAGASASLVKSSLPMIKS